MDGSVARGPFSFWRRVPTLASAPREVGPLLAFAAATDFTAALAFDLLLIPPTDDPPASGPVTCASCSPSVPDASLAVLGPRHHIVCGHGSRLSGTVHDPVVRALVVILEAVFGTGRVIPHIRGRGGDQGRRMNDWMAGAGAGLFHCPDVVVLGMDAPDHQLLDTST